MRLRRLGLGIVSVSLTVLSADRVASQSYPSKPISIYTATPGGSLDFGGRVIAQGITGSLGQAVLVANRPASVLGDIVAKAPPDGYTLLLAGGNIYITPLLTRNLPYDFERDFAPITLTSRTPNVLVVHPALPVKSVRELIALAKARPGALNYGSAGTGGSTQLAAELFKSMAGVNIMHISYRGDSAALIDMLAGQTQLTFATITIAVPYMKSGRMRALAVASAQRSALLPELPTIADSGLPGYESSALNVMLAPKKTPATIVNRLSDEIVRVLGTAATKEKYFSMGLEVIGSSPSQVDAIIKADIARWSKVIKDAGLRAE